MLKLYVKTQIAVNDMKTATKKFYDDVDGASLIEYSLLIGLISAAVVASIIAISPKIADYWADLNAAMPAAD